jgi:hypothetical protein
MGSAAKTHHLPEPETEDLERIRGLLQRIGGVHVVWGAQQVLDVWAIEQRAQLDQRMSERIRTASWALVVATCGLALCTGGLIWATLANT